MGLLCLNISQLIEDIVNYINITSRGNHIRGIKLQSHEICNKRVVWESLELKYVTNAWSGNHLS